MSARYKWSTRRDSKVARVSSTQPFVYIVGSRNLALQPDRHILAIPPSRQEKST